MSRHYVAEQYAVAIASLATRRCSLQHRLHDAYLGSRRVRPEDMPNEEWQNEHEAIHGALVAVKKGHGDGCLRKTLNLMSNEEEAAMASRLAEFSAEIPGPSYRETYTASVVV